jgi:hypothetical protein
LSLKLEAFGRSIVSGLGATAPRSAGRPQGRHPTTHGVLRYAFAEEAAPLPNAPTQQTVQTRCCCRRNGPRCAARAAPGAFRYSNRDIKWGAPPSRSRANSPSTEKRAQLCPGRSAAINRSRHISRPIAVETQADTGCDAPSGHSANLGKIQIEMLVESRTSRGVFRPTSPAEPWWSCHGPRGVPVGGESG